jgi:hypothetical protein
MEKTAIKCNWTKPCFERDTQNEDKCKNCIHNLLSKEEHKKDWPRLLLVTGWF